MLADQSLFEVLKDFEHNSTDSSFYNLTNPFEPIPLPPSFSHGENMKSAIPENEFVDLFDVVTRVLELTDIEELQDLEIDPASQPSSWLTYNLPSSIPSSWSQPTKHQEELSSRDKAFSQLQSGKWYERYRELVQFQSEQGHCRVPSHFPSNPPLAQWVKRQRYQYKMQKEGQHSTMTAERQLLLEDLAFVWDSHSSFWEDRLGELATFRERHGHANVPTKYPENPQLAIWAKCQRRQFKIFWTSDPKRSNMTLDRINKLTAIGFVFDPRELKRQMKKPA